MTDEEKKAIKEVKHFKELTRYWQEEEYEEKEIAGYIETVLNLIEKQQKEIEELKEGFKIQEHNYQVAMEEIEQRWEDKIKAKIEEYENKIKKIRSKKVINEPEDTIIITRYAHYISVMQSLLEKE